MEREEVVEKLRDILRKILRNPSLEIHDALTAKDVPGWDSLNHINIIVAAEKKFGIKFTTKEVQNLPNVGAFVDLIVSKI